MSRQKLILIGVIVAIGVAALGWLMIIEAVEDCADTCTGVATVSMPVWAHAIAIGLIVVIANLFTIGGRKNED